MAFVVACLSFYSSFLSSSSASLSREEDESSEETTAGVDFFSSFSFLDPSDEILIEELS